MSDEMVPLHVLQVRDNYIKELEQRLTDLRSQLALQTEPIAHVVRLFGIERAEIMGYVQGGLTENMKLYSAPSKVTNDGQDLLSSADIEKLWKRNCRPEFESDYLDFAHEVIKAALHAQLKKGVT